MIDADPRSDPLCRRCGCEPISLTPPELHVRELKRRGRFNETRIGFPEQSSRIAVKTEMIFAQRIKGNDFPSDYVMRHSLAPPNSKWTSAEL